MLARVDERTRKIETDLVGLTANFAGLKTDFAGLKIDLAELKGRVSQLPSTIQMIGFVLAVLALAGFSKYLGR